MKEEVTRIAKKKQETAARLAASRRMENNKEVEKEQKTKIVKLGDSQDLHDQEDWAWDELEDEWSNTIERKKEY